MRVRYAVATIALLCASAAATPAYAYNETGSVDASLTTCFACHGASTVSTSPSSPDRYGPHAGYTTTSGKCQGCHNVHASLGPTLLQKATVTATCNMCHDGTGGRGVYGVLVARGFFPGARHRVDSTKIIPSGDPAGGSRSETFTGGVGATLGCIDCHSPHNSSTVASFTGDRKRTATGTVGVFSNRLLRQVPIGSDMTTTVYGSAWCGGCHRGSRDIGSAGAYSHASDLATSAGSSSYYYERVSKVTTWASSATTIGTLGANNYGYVMPDTFGTYQAGHYPICMQCHEDAREVGDVVFGQVAVTETFAVLSADGTRAADNPRFQTFPHETYNLSMLVENDSDLCTNCHMF